MKNNVSKLNQDQRRFSSEFTVRIGAPSITAILCADSVSDYKVVDKKSSDTLIASDKRPQHLRSPQEDSTDCSDVQPAIPVDKQRPDNSACHPQAAPVMDKIFSSPAQHPEKFRKISHPPPPPRTPYQEKIQNNQIQPFRGEFICTHPEGIYRRPALPAFLFQPPINPAEPTTMHSLSILANCANSLMASDMYFTSTELDPREVDESDVSMPFPFKAGDPSIEQQHILGFSPTISPGTSDNVRAVISVVDMMQLPSYQSFE
jgi:hypothetical protein